MNVLAGLYVGDHPADVLAVPGNGVARLQLLQCRHDRSDVVLGNKLGRRIILGDDTEHVCAGLETFDDTTGVVLRTVHESANFRHCLSPMIGGIAVIWCSIDTPRLMWERPKMECAAGLQNLL